MGLAATMIAVAALAVAFAAWAFGAHAYLRSLREQTGHPLKSTDAALALVWPFARSRITATPETAARINKALVAVFTSLMVAVAATSIATNLSRLSR